MPAYFKKNPQQNSRCPMYRARIETLEKRQMFAADNLSDVVAAYALGNCPNWFADPNPPPILGDPHNRLADDSAVNVAFLDEFDVGAPLSLAKMHLEDVSLGFVDARQVGSFLGNGDGVLATWAGGQEGEEVMLPFIEQDNLYKMTDISDGSSNTIMFAEVASRLEDSRGPHNEQTGSTSNGIIAVLIGLAVDPADPSDHGGSTASLDTWEHATMDRHGPATNQIIAILIGLAADPSDPSGNTYLSSNVAFADGSVHLLAPDVNGMAALPASDEFFARFANTIFDDEALVATTYGRGGRASQITHDMEFEKWASASKFDRGQESSSFYDLLISSYLERTQDPAAPTLSIASDGAFIDV